MRIPSSKGFSAASVTPVRETPSSPSAAEFRLPLEVDEKNPVEVRLSDRAALHSTALQTLKDLSETKEARQERIAKLREQVARGEYRVRSGDIADAILRKTMSE